jgi:hypothetical protein
MYLSDAELKSRATAVLDENWREGYTIPSARLYPFQWNWDAGFIAIGWGHHRPERALEEVRSMFSTQWRSGMVPHIAFHRPDPNYFPGPEIWRPDRSPEAPTRVATSGITQPPVFGFTLERLAGSPAGQLPEWRPFLAEILPKVAAFHRYLYHRRDPAGEGLVYVQHNWEVGTDNSPTWDPILDSIQSDRFRDVAALRKDVKRVSATHRPPHSHYQRYIYLLDLFAEANYDDREIAARSPFLVQDVLFNSMLVRSNLGLFRLGRTAGLEFPDLEELNARTAAAINEKLWDPERRFYVGYDLRSGRRIPVKTSSGFMPLFAGICPPERAELLAGHLEHAFDPAAGWRLCPSTAADEPGFDPVRYWRGPVWVNLNWMLYQGLRNSGRAALAERVKADTLGLIREFGMYEYFDPRPRAAGGSGEGLGADKFSWTAALCLDWLADPGPI